MYNILKGQVVSADDSSRQVIDSNERMEKIIERQMRLMERLAEERRQKQIEDFIESLEPDEEGKPIIPTDEEGNYLLPLDDEGNPLLFLHSDGYLSEEPEPEIEEEPEPEEPEEEEVPPINREEILAEIQRESDEILAKAREEAEQILDQANRDAQEQEASAQEMIEKAKEERDRIFEESKQTGHQQGYDLGYREATAKAQEEFQARMEEAETDIAQRMQALDRDKEQMQAEFAAREEDMEHQMADVFCDIIDKVFHIEFSDKKEILLYLIDNVIANTAGSREYLIRINDKNFDLINRSRDTLIDKIGGNVTLDIVKDPLLGEEECQIETDGGIYDCGMDTQLTNLLKDLRALSLV